MGSGGHRVSPPPSPRYRKIPGDKCSGGESPSREETDMKKKCTSNFLNPSQLVGDGDTGPGPPPWARGHLPPVAAEPITQ